MMGSEKALGESHRTESPRETKRTAFTQELTELCRNHGVGIEGGRIWEMDRNWTGPDADINAEYAVDEEGNLIRTF